MVGTIVIFLHLTHAWHGNCTGHKWLLECVWVFFFLQFACDTWTSVCLFMNKDLFATTQITLYLSVKLKSRHKCKIDDNKCPIVGSLSLFFCFVFSLQFAGSSLKVYKEKVAVDENRLCIGHQGYMLKRKMTLADTTNDNQWTSANAVHSNDKLFSICTFACRLTDEPNVCVVGLVCMLLSICKFQAYSHTELMFHIMSQDHNVQVNRLRKLTFVSLQNSVISK